MDLSHTMAFLSIQKNEQGVSNFKTSKDHTDRAFILLTYGTFLSSLSNLTGNNPCRYLQKRGTT